MACVVCRLPFLPDEHISSAPLKEHFVPSGILSASEKRYFSSGIAMGSYVPGFYVPIIYNSANMFGGNHVPIALTMMWETNHEQLPESVTIQTMHKTCATLLRKVFEAEKDTLEDFIKLAHIEHVLGAPVGGMKTGRWSFVDYETCGGTRPAVDIQQFWRRGNGEGLNWFDWKACDKSDLKWTFTRPDTFPRFFKEIDLTKVIPENTEDTRDVITNLPSDILHALLPYLDLKAYLAFTGTCRFLRHRAHTEWRAHARARVVSLGWAVPVKSELAMLSEQEKATMANPDKLSGDWFRYLLHAHATKGLRVRRWVWSICSEIKKEVDARYPESGLQDLKDGVKSPERKKLDRKIQQLWQIHQLFSMGSMGANIDFMNLGKNM